MPPTISEAIQSADKARKKLNARYLENLTEPNIKDLACTSHQKQFTCITGYHNSYSEDCSVLDELRLPTLASASQEIEDFFNEGCVRQTSHPESHPGASEESHSVETHNRRIQTPIRDLSPPSSVAGIDNHFRVESVFDSIKSPTFPANVTKASVYYDSKLGLSWDEEDYSWDRSRNNLIDPRRDPITPAKQKASFTRTPEPRSQNMAKSIPPSPAAQRSSENVTEQLNPEASLSEALQRSTQSSQLTNPNSSTQSQMPPSTSREIGRATGKCKDNVADDSRSKSSGVSKTPAEGSAHPEVASDDAVSATEKAISIGCFVSSTDNILGQNRFAEAVPAERQRGKADQSTPHTSALQVSPTASVGNETGMSLGDFPEISSDDEVDLVNPFSQQPEADELDKLAYIATPTPLPPDTPSSPLLPAYTHEQPTPVTPTPKPLEDQRDEAPANSSQAHPNRSPELLGNMRVRDVFNSPFIVPESVQSLPKKPAKAEEESAKSSHRNTLRSRSISVGSPATPKILMRACARGQPIKAIYHTPPESKSEDPTKHSAQKPSLLVPNQPPPRSNPCSSETFTIRNAGTINIASLPIEKISPKPNNAPPTITKTATTAPHTSPNPNTNTQPSEKQKMPRNPRKSNASASATSPAMTRRKSAEAAKTAEDGATAAAKPKAKRGHPSSRSGTQQTTPAKRPRRSSRKSGEDVEKGGM